MGHPAIDLLRLAAQMGATVTLPPEVSQQVVDSARPDEGEWGGMAEAAKLLNMGASTVRARAAHWARMTAEGGRPMVRTRKKDPANPRSHYEFHLGDCTRNRRADRGKDDGTGARRRGHLAVQDGGAKEMGVDERERTIQHYVGRYLNSFKQGA